MKTRRGSAVLIVFAAAVARLGIAHASSPPQWVLAQVNAPTPEHDEKTTGVLLYSESVLTVQPNGNFKHLERRVYRILRPDGSRLGMVRVDIDAQTKLDNLHGWSIPAGGKPYEVGQRDAVESSLVGVENGELMSDARSELLRIPAALPGNIVACEWEVEERPYQLTDEWLFEDTVPVREIHYTVQLPPGWSYKASWLNHPEQSGMGVGAGGTHWVLHDLKAIPVEERMPPWQGIAGRMVVSLQPPTGQPQGFQSWLDMGVWFQGLTRGRTDASPQIKQKVAELVQSSPTLFAKMKRLAAFVQDDVRYVAIKLGMGGFQPHAAADVFTHRYGDCKDKATLLKAMLGEIGVESEYFIINTERGAISRDTVPTLGFNHAILAIHLPAGVADPSLLAVSTEVDHARLLFFDPTDTLTPFGSLRGVLQASYGVLMTSEGGVLTRTPQLSNRLNGIERTAKMTLDETGSLHGDVHEVWSGDMASEQRAAARASTLDTDRIKPVEAVAGSAFTSFDILKATVANVRINDRPYEWNYTIEAPRYAKSAGDLLLVRPRILGSKASGLLETKEPRRFPIEFSSPERDADVFEIEMPAGYVVDELPPAVSADYGFVAYQSKTEAVGRTLRYTRTFEVRDLSVPVSKAEKLKEFYRIVENDERNSAVLKPASAQ